MRPRHLGVQTEASVGVGLDDRRLVQAAVTCHEKQLAFFSPGDKSLHCRPHGETRYDVGVGVMDQANVSGWAR